MQSRLRERFHLPISGSLGAVIAVCFFLPWYRIQCSEERVLLDPSGYNLATGRPDAEAEAEARRVAHEFRDAPGEKPPAHAKNEPPVPELWAILAVGVALFLWGFGRLVRPSRALRRETVVALILSCAALGFLGVERAVLYRRDDLQDERQEEKEEEERRAKSATAGEEGQDEGKREDRYGFYLTIGALGAAVVVQAGWLALSRRRYRAAPALAD
ncbi:MAG: hypothetical protein HYY18_13065 [Planctomycetes bacterium]|nr:hypothetical protein [Planctomycetota bacterium]